MGSPVKLQGWFPETRYLQALGAAAAVIGLASAAPIYLLAAGGLPLWAHVPLMAISLGCLTVGSAICGIVYAEHNLRKRQAG